MWAGGAVITGRALRRWQRQVLEEASCPHTGWKGRGWLLFQRSPGGHLKGHGSDRQDLMVLEVVRAARTDLAVWKFEKGRKGGAHPGLGAGMNLRGVTEAATAPAEGVLWALGGSGDGGSGVTSSHPVGREQAG